MKDFFDPNLLFHIGYVVPNMERALKIWEKQGAVLLVPPAVDPIQNVWCSLIVYRNSIPIELVAPRPDGPNPIETRLRKGGGLDHICLFSDDLAADIQDFSAAGGTVVVAPCYGAVFDRELAFLTTRSGLTIELMTRAGVGRQEVDPLASFFDLTDGQS